MAESEDFGVMFIDYSCSSPPLPLQLKLLPALPLPLLLQLLLQMSDVE
jgi:hypothetical protein